MEFKLPELGENVEKGDVVRVLVTVGDMVKKDQPVLELETDKATIEVPSNVRGKVSAVRVKVGDKVKVGQAVLVLEDDGRGATNGAAAAAPAAEAPSPPAPAAEPAKRAEAARPAAPRSRRACGRRRSGMPITPSSKPRGRRCGKTRRQARARR